MKRLLLLTTAIIIAILYIFYVPNEPVSIKIMMKLVPMMLIIFYALSTRTLISKTYKWLIITGLFISMIADGVIYWFLAGLVTFFIAHILYIVAFRHVSQKPVPKWAATLLLLYGASIAFWIAGSQLKEGEIFLGVAIIAYITIILVMGWMAIRTRLPLVIIGALLFMFSDSALAIDRFMFDIPNRDAVVMLTYYAAQVFIASSIGSRVVKYSVNRKNLIG